MYLQMIRMTTQLISGGRITINQPIRNELNVKEGDLVEIEIRPINTGS